MPYIKSVDYGRATRTPITAGELNYAITLNIIDTLHPETGSIAYTEFYGRVTKLCDAYIVRRGLTYTIGNEVMGVLTCAGLEMIRRCGETGAVWRLMDMLAKISSHIYYDILAPYEDGKIKENGDVYPKALVG